VNTKSQEPPRRHIGCILVVIIIGGIVGLAIVLFLMQLTPPKDGFLEKHLAEIKSGQTNSFSIFRPEYCESISQDPELAAKIAEVYILETIPDTSDKRFQNLKLLPNLKKLRCEYVGCVDGLLENIAGMKSLEELSFHRAGVTTRGMQFVLSFPNLKKLKLENATDKAAVNMLKDHPGLESLILGDTDSVMNVSPILKSLPSLKILAIYGDGGEDCKIDLRDSPNLEYLSLHYINISEDMFAAVKELKKLKELKLDRRKVTDEELNRLREALPNCKIETDTY
jgi:hypothetical protein